MVLTKIHLYMYVLYLLRLKIYVCLRDISKVKFTGTYPVSDYVLMIVGNSYLTNDSPCR